MREIAIVPLVWPWRIGGENTIGPSVPGKRRRLSSDSLRLLAFSQPLENSVDAAGAIHVGEQAYRTARAPLGGVDDGFGLLNVRRDSPIACAVLSADRPLSVGQASQSFAAVSCALALRSFAAACSTGSSVRLIATASDSVKSLRTVFSANSPRTTASRSTTVTRIFVHPSNCAARRRRSPAISVPSGRMTIGCSSPCLLDALRERVDVADIAPMPRAGNDLFDGQLHVLALAYFICPRSFRASSPRTLASAFTPPVANAATARNNSVSLAAALASNLA